MGITELRRAKAHEFGAFEMPNSLGRDLVRAGTISQSDASLAQMVGRHCDASLDRILRSEGLANEKDLLAAHARRLSSTCLTSSEVTKSAPLDVPVAPQTLLKHGVLPIAGPKGRPTVAVSNPEAFRAAQAELPMEINAAQVVIAPRQAIQETIALQHREYLTEAAQARVPGIESCRSWGNAFHKRLGFTLAGIAGLIGVTMAFPAAVFSVFAIWAVFTLIVSATMKTSSFIASFSAREEESHPQPGKGHQPLPRISVLVPLFKETEIAHALIARLSRLTYPKCLLDVVLVLEEKDHLTRETLAGIDLPDWVRPVIVPDGAPRTKPRAMNYALDFCEGDIIGIFDAEDAPEPDQLTIVARQFEKAPPDVVCLQGILDYYNPRQNWLARCFTIEYATWFRVMMSGMARLGFAIPLGGTTLYFRRTVLEELGGWDAHNVTEDADLGFRLARHGYRTEMITTVTEEEANCRPWAWIKQRSRWLKGYMTTYLVHMRKPHLLYKQLGAWKFWGFQAHFVSALSQFILAPFLWSFWLVLFGFRHPLEAIYPHQTLVIFCSLFLVVEMLNITVHSVAVSGPRHRHLMIWAPSMYFYAPLGAVAAYKALYELIMKPFFWDKTAHGHSLGTGLVLQSDQTVELAGIKLETGHESL